VKKQIEKMTSSDYHGHKAISSTDLKKALRSMGHYRAYKDGLVPFGSKVAFDVGTAAHSAILEQDFTSYVKGPDVSRATKKWKEFVIEHEDKIVLKPSEYDHIRGMYDSFYGHPKAAKVTSNGRPEVSFFAQHETGLLVKARPDFYVQSGDGDYIVDYKTALSASPEDFARTIYKYRYDISAAYYMRIVEQVTGRKVRDFFWIVQEKEAPYALSIYRADEEMLAAAHAKCEKLLAQITNSESSGEWKTYPTDICNIDMPSWAYAKDVDDE